MAPQQLPDAHREAFNTAMEKLFRMAGLPEHAFNWSFFDQIQVGASDTGLFNSISAPTASTSLSLSGNAAATSRSWSCIK